MISEQQRAEFLAFNHAAMRRMDDLGKRIYDARSGASDGDALSVLIAHVQAVICDMVANKDRERAMELVRESAAVLEHTVINCLNMSDGKPPLPPGREPSWVSPESVSLKAFVASKYPA